MDLPNYKYIEQVQKEDFFFFACSLVSWISQWEILYIFFYIFVFLYIYGQEESGINKMNHEALKWF